MGVYNRLMIGYEKFMWENMSWNLDSMGYKYKLWKTKQEIIYVKLKKGYVKKLCKKVQIS